MAGFFRALGRGIARVTESLGPQRYELAGKLVVCPHCGHDRFAEGKAQLNTAGMSFLNLDWANRTATTLVCGQCGRIEWFLQKPTRLAQGQQQ
jgi:predicted nucleic-acid-binding Zn-ribbon protein